MSSVRGACILAAFFALTVPLMPVQAVLLRTSLKGARRFPHWYHRQVCRLLGVRLSIEGAVAQDRPVLLVSNHVSWLDIPVLSAVAPVSFVAKKDVERWPFVSQLAKLQRTVFVDRERRTAVGAVANEMIERLKLGDALVLFAEGTSSDGNRVLPFKTPLFAAAKPGSKGADAPHEAVVQTIAIVYKRLHGVTLGRGERHRVGWYGDMEMGSHAWNLLKSGPLDVMIRIGPPQLLDSFADRKELARRTETQVREDVVRLLRGRAADDALVVTDPSDEQRRAKRPQSAAVLEPGTGNSFR